MTELLKYFFVCATALIFLQFFSSFIFIVGTFT